ncbi:MAG: EamA/RhaT family transporter [Hyphomonadaceae bacterium]
MWPLITLGAAVLQVVRNAAQRGLVASLGLWGASYVRFLYGLPFALIWGAAILAWRGPSGAASVAFALWILLGAATQGAATGALVFAMRRRGFAVASALQKSEVLGAALLGVVLIQDKLTGADWAGAALGTAGVTLMARVSIDRAAVRAAWAGVGAGLLFAFSAVSYRAAALAWGPDPWIGAAATLAATLATQTIGGGALLAACAPKALAGVLRAWRPSLTPGAAGAFSSALLFTGFALGPSAAAVKTVQLADVLIAWVVSRRLMREETSAVEALGACLVVMGAGTLLLL